jgi:hypothetical protein
MNRFQSCLAFLTLGALSLFACTQSTEEQGIFEGHVTIGPLVPVLREGEEVPTPAPEVYAAREIVIFHEDGEAEYTRLKIDAKGNYRAELPVGLYIVDINHVGIDRAAGLPKQIEITNRSVIRLDIDIDTGIR